MEKEKEKEKEASIEQPVGECIFDGGAWQFQGYDENGSRRSLNGRLTGAHKVLCSCWRNLVQRTTIFLFGIRQWFRDSSAQQQWP